MYQQLCRRMVELIGGNSLKKTHFINDGRKMRKMFTHPGTALTILREAGLRSQHLGYASDKSKSFSLEQRRRTILSIEFHQFGLVIKKLQLRRCSRHVQINNTLCFSWKHGKLGSEWMCRIKR